MDVHLSFVKAFDDKKERIRSSISDRKRKRVDSCVEERRKKVKSKINEKKVKQTSEKNKKTSRISWQKSKLSKANKKDEWNCDHCNFNYGQKEDLKISEDWVSCTRCHKRYHESCTEIYGVLEDKYTFYCIQPVKNCHNLARLQLGYFITLQI